MSHLAIAMFGGFRVELDGKPLTVFRTDKNRALLAYLALESEHSHRREALANLLWSDHNQSVARNSLRQAIYQLRRIINLDSEIEPHLLITPNEVQFNPASDYWIDVTEFKSCLSNCLSHQPSSLSLDDDCLKNLQRAIDLYQGEMLAGFTLPHCAEFTDWQIVTQEVCHHNALTALTLLADYFEAHHEYKQLIVYTQRKIELEPWRESAYRRQMWALAMTGQREQALLRFTTLKEVLLRELGISPTDRIKNLYQQIRDGELPDPFVIQGEPSYSLTSGYQPLLDGSTPFVERQSELAQLDFHLRNSLARQGRIAFISGEAGSGKTALMNEFAHRAMRANDDLLVAGGTCNAYNGLGDPYQPFREILESIAGVNAAPSSGAMVFQECARRLSIARPALLQTLLETSPGLVGTLLTPHDLLHQAKKTAGIDAVVIARLENLTEHHNSGQKANINPNSKIAFPSSMTIDLMQLCLYDQVARLLQAISYRFPILLLLDDLQWLDSTSASLLFHLRSCLSGRRILLLGAYRPEDLASSQGLMRHPLISVLNECQRRFGEIQVALSRADGRAFVHAYLDRQPNHFDQDFRETLYRHTAGNALFTVELLHAMQARNEVVQDTNGHWVQQSPIDWEPLPARVEAVFVEQLSRLNRECLTLVKAASVQGEVFTIGPLAQVLGVTVERVITNLSGSLCKQHFLVSPIDPSEKDGDQHARYQFRCLLFQKYLYQSLDGVERKHLQCSTAAALEKAVV